MDFSLNKIITIPNILSFSRILLVPVIGWFLFQDTVSGAIWAGVLLVISIATDFLDGFFARLLNQISDLGKILDPLADKLFVAVLVVELIFLRDFPVAIAVLLVAKDLAIVIASGMIVGKNKIVLPSNVIGKYAFGFQAGLILSYFLRFDYGIWFFTIFTLLFVILSIFSYGKILLFVLKNMKEGEELKVPPAKQYVATWLRRAAVGVAAAAFFFHLYYWAFENNEKVTKNKFDNFTVVSGEKLIDEFIPIFLGDVRKITDAEEFYQNAEFKAGSRFFWGACDFSEAAGSRDSYIKSSKASGSRPPVYYRVLELKDPDLNIAYFIQFWVLFEKETGPVGREGDWQMVGVCLSRDGNPSHFVFTQGWFTRVVSSDEIQTQGKRPYVFVGKESNSFYHAVDTAQIFLDQEGIISLGQEELYEYSDIIDPASVSLVELDESEKWVLWQGRWGGALPGGDRGPLWWNPKNADLAPLQNPVGFLKFYLNLKGAE